MRTIAKLAALVVVLKVVLPVLRGPLWVRSLKSYGLMAAFFISLAAVYMNHYAAAVKPFYFWSMVDALILFPLVGLANAVIYPWFFRERAMAARATRDGGPA